MPNIGKLLKDEIVRLARRQVKAALGGVRKDTVRLKRTVASLRRQVVGAARQNKELAQRLTPVVAATEAQQASEKAGKIRVKAERIKRLRAKLGLSQADFGKLVGVSAQSVLQWENKPGRLRLRESTRKALAAVLVMGRREAGKRLRAVRATTAAVKGAAGRRRKAARRRNAG